MFIYFLWRERNTDIEWLSPVHAPIRDPTCNLGVCPDQGWNPPPFGVPANALTETMLLPRPG